MRREGASVFVIASVWMRGIESGFNIYELVVGWSLHQRMRRRDRGDDPGYASSKDVSRTSARPLPRLTTRVFNSHGASWMA